MTRSILAARSVYFLVLLGGMVGCDSVAPSESPPPAVEYLPGARKDSFDLRVLNPEELWYTQAVAQYVGTYVFDSLGVPVYRAADSSLHHHPVSIAQLSLKMLSNSALTGDTIALNKVQLWTKTLIAEGHRSGGGIWFPYTFPFLLHGRAADALPAPWYSSMAQGQLLSVLVRLSKRTGDPAYRAWADSVFATIIALDAGSYSVAHVDSLGYFWMDEYPNGARTDLTLNGFLFTMYGVQEYWQLTRSPAAAEALRAGFTTLKRYVPSFRRPGALSVYCLRHEVQSSSYHAVHIEQLHDMYRVTGDVFFEEFADRFASDQDPSPSAIAEAFRIP